jgi:hypothetical protein
MYSGAPQESTTGAFGTRRLACGCYTGGVLCEAGERLWQEYRRLPMRGTAACRAALATYYSHIHPEWTVGECERSARTLHH